MDIANEYRAKREEIRRGVERFNRMVNANSLLRLVVILGGGALLFYTFQLENLLLVFCCFFLLLFGFAFLVRRQSILEKQRSYQERLLQVVENELRIGTGGLNMYDNGAAYEDGKHPYTADLDIFGPHSLYALLNRATTWLGNEQLSSWFLQPAEKTEICARQEATGDLADDLDWIHDFQAKLAANLNQKLEVKSFLQSYFEGDAFAFGNKFMRIYLVIGPILFVLALIGSVFLPQLGAIATILGFFHLFWALANAGKVSLFSSRVDKVGGLLNAYAEAIMTIEEREWKATSLKNLAAALGSTGNDTRISQAFKKLARLINNLDARNNVLVGIFLNVFLLWDFRQVLAIVDWKQRHESNILTAFDSLARMEALVSLATWKINHVDYTFPVILDNVLSDKIKAVGITHPLIEQGRAVPNDYDSIDHRIALVTGSNMAGKSTFLRTVGINAVLTYTGAVVAATELELPIYRLISYMRIKDNLNESTSTFKAELDRMRFILETVAVDRSSFFLIDEMLRGTNSVDKYLGSRAIIKKLIHLEGKGMVATHDLQLATLEGEFPGVVKNFHFDIRVDDGQMLFDYRLKEGECKVFNASILLKGIGVFIDKEAGE